jgi:hypothetical protein
MAKRGRKPKQQYLPDMEPVTIQEIDDAADSYVDARDARMECLKSEISKKDLLGMFMKKHKLATYEYDGKVVTYEGEPTVKVKRKKSSEDNGDADDEE